MPLEGCLVHAKKIVGDLHDKLLGQKKDLIDGGMSERDAEQKVKDDFASQIHKQLHDDLNKLKSNAKVKAATYSKPNPDLAEINKKHDEQLAALGGKSEVPPSEPQTVNAGGGSKETVGIKHQSLSDLADRLGLQKPKEGEYMPLEWYIERGKRLLAAGADVNKLEADFKSGKQPSSDDISVARAHLADLTKNANAMGDKWGEKSQQYKDALSDLNRFKDEVAKPMGTKAGEAFFSLQGEEDLDTGSVTSLRNAISDAKDGKNLTDKELSKTKELSSRVKEAQKADKAVDDKIEKAVNDIKSKSPPKDKKTNTEQFKEYADKFRNALKQNPITFKDENGNDVEIQKMGIGWNDLVELGAKAIEKTGEIADGVNAIMKEIKDQDWFKKLNPRQQDKLKSDIKYHFVQQDLSERFADKKDNKFTQHDAVDVWSYIKDNYLSQNVSFDNAIKNTSTDLGLTAEQVQHAISSDKTLKSLTNQKYLSQFNLRRAQNVAKNYVDSKQSSFVGKLVKTPFEFLRKAKIFGHGPAAMETHAGPLKFNPELWPIVGKAYERQYKMLLSQSYYEKVMQAMKSSRNYGLAKRAGLANDPNIVFDDYQQGGGTNIFGKIGKASNRGFDVLKPLRQDLFDHYYNNLPASIRGDKDAPKMIADMVNHMTGTTGQIFKEGSNVGKVVETAVFAPKLEASRWARLIGDPAKTAKTLIGWKNATPAERAVAKIQLGRAGYFLGMYGVALGLNQGLLSATGSKHKVNFTDPTKPDWLSFKIGDKYIGLTGGLQATSRFIGNIFKSAFESKKELGKETRKDEEVKLGSNYLFNKLSPGASTIKDWMTHHDREGNTLPFFKDKPEKLGGERGKHLSMWEYLYKTQTPIPAETTIQEIDDEMKKQGVSKPTRGDIIQGVIIGALTGAEGAHIGAEPKQKQ
jgi:hypothetical protein